MNLNRARFVGVKTFQKSMRIGDIIELYVKNVFVVALVVSVKKIGSICGTAAQGRNNMTMKQLVEVIKFYQKQVTDVDKASHRNFELYQNSSVSQRQKRARKLALCQEAKERAFWEVVEAIKKSEFGPVLCSINDKELNNIKTFNSRYLPPAQAAELAFKKEVK